MDLEPWVVENPRFSEQTWISGFDGNGVAGLIESNLVVSQRFLAFCFGGAVDLPDDGDFELGGFSGFELQVTGVGVDDKACTRGNRELALDGIFGGGTTENGWN